MFQHSQPIFMSTTNTKLQKQQIEVAAFCVPRIYIFQILIVKKCTPSPWLARALCLLLARFSSVYFPRQIHHCDATHAGWLKKTDYKQLQPVIREKGTRNFSASVRRHSACSEKCTHYTFKTCLNELISAFKVRERELSAVTSSTDSNLEANAFR